MAADQVSYRYSPAQKTSSGKWIFNQKDEDELISVSRRAISQLGFFSSSGLEWKHVSDFANGQISDSVYRFGSAQRYSVRSTISIRANMEQVVSFFVNSNGQAYRQMMQLVYGKSFLDGDEIYRKPQGKRDDLSLKWAILHPKQHYLLLDYHCLMLDDWNPSASGTMFLKIFQSIDQLSSIIGPSLNLEPVQIPPIGVLIRQSPETGFTEIQCITCIHETRSSILSRFRNRSRARNICLLVNQIEKYLIARRLQPMLSKGPIKYVEKTFRRQCCACREKFSWKRAAYHCQGCGEVYCKKCTLQVTLNGIDQLKVCLFCMHKAELKLKT